MRWCVAPPTVDDDIGIGQRLEPRYETDDQHRQNELHQQRQWQRDAAAALASGGVLPPLDEQILAQQHGRNATGLHATFSGGRDRACCWSDVMDELGLLLGEANLVVADHISLQYSIQQYHVQYSCVSTV